MITNWTDSILLQDFIVFILAVFLLRLARFAVTFAADWLEEILLNNFAGKKEYTNSRGNVAHYQYGENEEKIKAFIRKIDFIVNKVTVFGIRWHFVAAFLYVLIQGHILQSR